MAKIELPVKNSINFTSEFIRTLKVAMILKRVPTLYEIFY